MIKSQELSGILMGGVVALLATQPVWAAATPVTSVRINRGDNSFQLILATQAGDRPRIFTRSSGNDLITDLSNTQLRLSQGGSFRQDNPLPGIKSVVVAQQDANSVRIIVSGENGTPKPQILQETGKDITLGFSSSGGNSTNISQTPPPPPSSVPTLTPPEATTPNNPNSTPQPTPELPPNNPSPTVQTQTPQPTIPPAKPEAVLPNPDVPNIDGKPGNPADTLQPVAPAPPFLPRAIAPPVGDISVSNINVATPSIDLGTASRVPRLVLKDAPVRDVLALLARTAGLNVAFAETSGAAAAAPGATSTASTGSTISLDIENESVQNVFNYVLRISGLEASLNARTIFIGAKLPDAAKDLVMRTLRLNQMKATMAETLETISKNSASSLSNSSGGSGASTISQLGRNTTSSQTIPMRGALQILEALGANNKGDTLAAGATPTSGSSQILKGLQATADSYTNSVTLVGTPNLVEIATSRLIQLDVRRRQVAVNVKIVDVNLLNTENVGASFSFGVADNFFSVNNGSLNANVGQFRPPTATEISGSLTGLPTINNPYSGATSFLDFNTGQVVPSSVTGQGTLTINPSVINAVPTITPAGPTTFYTGAVPLTSNPFASGITQLTPGTPDVFTITPGTTTITNGIATTTPATSSFSRGTPATVTSALPSIFQFPKQFLGSLQAQIQSGNAKILTDPTLIVQEGNQSQVNLTQGIVTKRLVTTTFPTTGPSTQVVTVETGDVGVILNIAVDRIDDNGFITMSVSPEVSTAQPPINDSQGNILATPINRRRLETGNVRLRDSQTLILTGIIQERETTTVTKVPVLGDIPIIGSLFRSTNRQNQRNEVIVLVTPQIMDDSDRSSFGYNYTPSRETRQILQQRGFPTQGGR